MQIDSQSEGHLESSRSISTTIQTDAFSTTENTIIASNACAFRVITNQFLRFQRMRLVVTLTSTQSF